MRDPARGARRYRLDAQGRPYEGILADGRALRIFHDERGALRRIQSDDGFSLAIDSASPDATFSVEDESGRTQVLLDKGGRRRILRRGSDALAIELDHQERIRRVRIPGSSRALLYNWKGDGSCEIKAAGGPALVSLSEQGGFRCVEIGPGVGWRERIRPDSVVLETVGDLDPGPSRIVIELDRRARSKSRTWSDGRRESFTRDGRGRLSGWTRRDAEGNALERRVYRYQGDDLLEEESLRGTARRELDAAGRVLGLTRSDGTRVVYQYDAAGRRVSRTDGDRTRRYEYDVLGQLRRIVDDDEGVTSMAYDGLGRRLSVTRGGEVELEHRDEAGRLWAITDEDGVALHTFLWVGDRMVARLDGPVGSSVVEGYVTDPFGTVLAVIHLGSDRSPRLERLESPPFGEISSDARPTLYGHVGRVDLGLIHFGARDLDPELGLFLTPDPWHGGEDDPRRWAGASGSYLRREREIPEGGAHDYALCQFDPVGRSDRDGHVSVWDVLLHILRWILLPTWGFPLTSLSVFFFMPVNLYMEVVGLIIFGLKQFCDDKSHPWGNHTIVKATGLLGSLRQFTFAFGLNGFLPRVAVALLTGQKVSSNRAMTIGNVIWINREELSVLDRAEVIELWDIAGPPGGGATATGPGGAFLSSTTKESAVAVLGFDDDAKKRLHVSHWSRGFGNAVRDVGSHKAFKDEPVPSGSSFARGTMLLRKPFPTEFPYPEDEDDDEKLEVHEYLFDGSSNHSSRVETIVKVWFALRFPKSTSFSAGEWIQIEAPSAEPAEPPTYLRITDVVLANDHAAVMLHAAIPNRFRTRSLEKGLRVQKVDLASGATESQGWNPPGGATTLEVLEVGLASPPAAPPAGWPPTLTRGEPVRIVAASPAAPATPPPGVTPTPQDTIFARIESLSITLKLAPVFGAVTASTDVHLQRPHASSFQGVVEDPAADDEIKFSGSHPSLETDDLLLVTRPGTSEAAYVRATAVAGEGVTVQPSLAPAITLAANTAVRIQKYVDSNTDEDKGTVVSTSGDELVVEVARSNLFPDGRLVRFVADGAQVLREIDSLRKVKIRMGDEAVGTAPFRVAKARLVEGRVSSDIELAPPGRFLKHSSGDPPSAYGDYPSAILAIGDTAAFPDKSVFYVKWGGARPGDFHADYRRSWKPATSNGDSYWVLESPLPLLVDEIEGTPWIFWQTDAESGEETQRVPLQKVTAGPLILDAREYVPSGVRRADAASRRITAHPPEVQVPVDPTIHDTHARALIEHEIHHTVQCNFWGPLMGAFPLTGLIMLVSDIVQATGDTIPEWMKEVELDAHGNPPATADGRIDNNTELNLFQVASMGGLMQLAWKYIFLGPFRAFDGVPEEINPLDFSDWNKALNPVNSQLMEALPPVDPAARPEDRWLAALGQLVERAVDLRSWFPLLGFIPFFVPSNPFSFIEQGASRASGDLYSTILSANDRFNGKLRIAPDKHDADLHPHLGDVVRLMLYAGYRTDRTFHADHADRPDSPLRYMYASGAGKYSPSARKAFLVAPGGYEVVTMVSTDKVLLPPNLYEVNPTATTSTRNIEGPPGYTPEDFLEVSPGGVIVPGLFSLVPTPPRVNRSMGFYFLPASPGTLRIDAEYSSAGKADEDAGTQTVTLTVEDEVKLGDRTVDWELPPPVGSLPTIVIDRFFLTEKQPLKVTGRNIDGFVLVVTDPAGPPPGPFVTSTDLADRSGWDLQIGSTLPGGPVRIRLYRIIRKDDEAFDLTYDDVPTLRGVRSYLAKDVWIPIRDFHLQIQDIPGPGDQIKAYDEPCTFDSVIPLVAAARAFAIVPPAGLSTPSVEREGDHGRLERWHIGPLDDPVEDDALFRVTVTYGRAPHSVARSFTVTFQPRIHLPKHGGGTVYEASQGHPLELDITGGTAPYTVDADDLPSGTTVAISGGNQVTVEVAEAPPAARTVVVKVRDDSGKRGRRTIRVVP